MPEDIDRKKFVAKELEQMSEIQEKMELHYIGLITSFQKERRDMFRNFAAISAGGAAIAPQLLNFNAHPGLLFYGGISSLILASIIAITYTLSLIEISTDQLVTDKKNKVDEWGKLRAVKMKYMETMNSTDADFKEMIAQQEKLLESIPPKVQAVNSKKMKRFDYAGEYMMLFFTLGVCFLIISILEIHLSWKNIIGFVLGVFILINIFSAKADKIFVWLGWPVDYIKHTFRHKKS